MRKRILAIILSIALMLTVAVPIASAEPAVEEGLVFGYDFSTVDGTTVKDLSANGYDGTLRGTASVSDDFGYLGQGLRPSNSNNTHTGAMDLPDGILAGIKDFTFSAFVNPQASNTWQRIFDFGYGTLENMFLTVRGDDGSGGSNAVTFAITNSGNTAEEKITANVAVPANEWTHIAVTLQGSVGIMYVNGIEVARKDDFTLTPDSIGGADNNMLGDAQYDDAAYNGYIDEFKFYNYAMTPEQIAMQSVQGLDDQQAINKIMAAIPKLSGTVYDDLDFVLINGDLSKGEIKTSYNSLNKDIITNEGIVNRPQEDTDVSITIVVQKGGKSTYWGNKVTVKGTENYDGQLDINLNEDEKGPEISQDLFGLFFEDINYGADGGLYAELVQNRSFEYFMYAGRPTEDYHTYSWSTVNGASMNAVNDGTGIDAERNPYFLRVTTANANQGVANTGWTSEPSNMASVTATPYYDTGIYLQRGEKYNFSMFVKGPFTTDVTAQIVSDGEVIGKTVITEDVNESGWQKIKGEITAEATTWKGSLQVLFADAGTYDIDFVSLFPQKTYNNRENGLRADMVQVLKDMNPGFLRFPGGCIVEGKNLSNRYQWKDSVGPVETRKYNWNRWQTEVGRAYVYHQSYGLGFYEYMLLCEDIGAKALPVLNCGMGCQYQDSDVVPLDQLQPYIDDAIDFIEFCNGDPETNEWAALRAEMGHPEPFNLEYLAIGNEQWDWEYFERYDMFQAQIAPLYPEIKLLSTTGPNLDSSYWNNAKEWLSDKDRTHSWAYDEHYYISEAQMLGQHFDRYADENKYPRTEDGPYVFAGEYACHSGNAPTRQMTIRQALVEAAYMTTFEKNADIVKLAAYAPLFAKADHVQWNPNLIYATNTCAYGQPSYWTQWMYSTNIGDYQLDNQLSLKSDEEVEVPVASGKAGFATWVTQARYDNFKVTSNVDGSVLAEYKFEDAADADAFTSFANNGSWSVENGYYQQSATPNNVAVGKITGDETWSNYTIEVDAMKYGGNEGFLIPFLYKDANNYYWLNAGGWSNTQSCVEKCEDGAKSQYNFNTSWRAENNKWYHIKIVVGLDKAECYIDDQLISYINVTPWDQAETAISNVYHSASYDEDSREIIVKLINYNSSERDIRINLNDFAGYINPTGRVVQIQNDSLTAGNAENNQKNVAAVEFGYNGFAKNFNYVLPKYSITTLRISTLENSERVVDIEKQTVETEIGTVPQLPETCTVINADGSTTVKPVEWEKKPDSLYNVAGTFTVLGEVDGTKIDAQVDVVVNEKEPEVQIPVINGNEDGYAEVDVNEIITMQVVLPIEAFDIGLDNGYGKWLGNRIVSVVDNGDNTATWTVEFTYGTKGDRVVNVYADMGDGMVDMNIQGNILVRSPLTEIYDTVKAPMIAVANKVFEIEVTTDKNAKDIRISNEYGSDMGRTITDKTENADGTITWTVAMSVGSAGSRTFNVYALNADKAASDSVSFSIRIVK